MQKFISKIALAALIVVPFVTSAVAAPTNLKSLVTIITDLVGLLIVAVFALTFLAVMWGIIKGWIIKGGDAEGIESGKNVVFVGIIALVVMVSIWGILALLKAGLFGS